MKVSIMQPAYLPWLGYFDRISQSDLHIVLDHVNIDANSKTKFANRNKIRTPAGWTWLTVPLQSKGQHGRMFLDRVAIQSETPWAQKHLGTLRTNYARAAHFGEHKTFFEGVYGRDWPRLQQLVSETTNYLLEALKVNVPIKRSSEMNVAGEKADLILNLCREVGATTYISGPFGRDYLDQAAFEEAGIQVAFHDYQHPTYRQVFPGFEPHLSVVDLLFNHGPEAGDILRTKA